MSSKVYDLKVKTGTYQDRQGETKGRWETVGSMIQDERGGKYLLIKRTFNPAGVSVEQGRDHIIVSMFEPREYGDRGGDDRLAAAPSGGGGYETSGDGVFRRTEPLVDPAHNDAGHDIPF